MSENKLNLDFIDNLLPKNEFKSIEVKKLSDVVLSIDENRLEISEFISQDGDINPAIIKSNDENVLTNKYLHHFLRTKSNLIHELVKDKSNLIDSNLLKVLDIDITIPSINYQNKIIETIENLEKVCYKLEVDLSSDRSEKQKQLEIYEKLIFEYLESESFDQLTEKISNQDTIVNLIKLIQFIFNTTITIQLSKVAKLFRGEVISKDFIRQNPGEYPVYSSQTLNNGELGKISKYKFDGEYVSWTTDGYAGTVFYRSGKFSVTNVCGLIDVNKSIILPKYLYFYLSVNLDKYVNKTFSNAKLMSNQVAEVKVTFPNLETQKHIANILDIFSSYTEKLKAELKAELKARSTQYEYYRNSLLSNDKSKNLQENINFIKLGELGQFYSGLKSKNKNDFENGNKKFVTFNNVYNNPSLSLDINNFVKIQDGENQNKIMTGDILFTGSSENIHDAGMTSVVIGQINEDIYLNSFCFGLRPNEPELLNLSYIKHLLRSENIRSQITRCVNGVTRFNVSKEDIKNVTLPIPSLNIQNKIADVLDNFESICKDLKIGLPAEEIKRQQQYEFYRNSIFEYLETNSFEKLMREREREDNLTTGLIKLIQYIFNTNITIQLSKIAKLFRGEVISKDFIRQNPGEYPVYSSQTLNNGELGKISKYKFDGEYVSWTTDGYAGTVFYRSGKFSVTNVCGLIDVNKSIILPKYLYFYLSVNLDKYVNKTFSNAKLMSNQVAEVKVTFPTLETQFRIVHILENFESICKDLKIGLPAEEIKRQQQYEFYRDSIFEYLETNSFEKLMREREKIT
ncbi:restriction endonuclease subunit S [Mycoplasma sp. 4404]|uniref:restriction endonuclease subunit S n=1 Tax=Mycoplasma sp. 4404 TaxID=3108530 RepID=UPI002B1DBC82|nr:restriction endonuclease subunit S [Mycoplasma sp. 4404]MEA4162475.1 restriction endonuclease subunit S [Mycoplasma sp. 4404]